MKKIVMVASTPLYRARELAAEQCPPDLIDSLGRVYPNIQRRAVLSGQYDRGRIVTRFMEARDGE